MSQTYDILTVGAGSGGMAAAKRAASKGSKIGVIENRTVGGTCVARGCMPKKFLVLAARRMREFQSKGPHGLQADVTELDWADVIDHEQTVVEDLININREGLVEYDQIELIQGTGKFIDSNCLRVNGEVYEGKRIILASGMRPTQPAIEGVEYGMTSEEFLKNHNLPYSVAMVGGGYVSVEFASILDQFGVDVTIFQRPDSLIKQHDAEITEALHNSFLSRGIDVETGTEVHEITKTDRSYTLKYQQNGDLGRFTTDRVLVAAGRTPNTDNLGLGELGIETDSGFIPVDSTLRTKRNDVFAVGDITGKKPFTPVAIAEGKVAGENAASDAERSVNYEAVPSAVFTIPEIGSIGYTEREAENRFDTLQTAKKTFRPFSSVVRREKEEALIKLLYAGSDKRLVGLHVFGPHASEMVQGFAPAMRKGLYQDDLKDFPGIHPTIAEEIFSTKPN